MGISDLICALWAAGFRTCGSCQDFSLTRHRLQQRCAYVSFNTADEAKRFAVMVGTVLVRQVPDAEVLQAMEDEAYRAVFNSDAAGNPHFQVG